jgi:ribonuclease HI
VEVGGNGYTLKVHPKEVMNDLVHRVARQFSIDLPDYWHPTVISGTGNVCRYQEGGTIRLFATTESTLATVTEPRTAKGSVAKMPKAVGGPPPRHSAKVQEPPHDWIQELKDRGETQEQDVKKSSEQIQVDNMITLTTDGGVRPNPGSAGWGALIRQNKKFICLWKHYDHASNNAMEISAVIAGLTFLPANMVVWVSTDSQYAQKGINGWMPNWKRNGWKNSKKSGIAHKSPWIVVAFRIQQRFISLNRHWTSRAPGGSVARRFNNVVMFTSNRSVHKI